MPVDAVDHHQGTSRGRLGAVVQNDVPERPGTQSGEDDGSRCLPDRKWSCYGSQLERLAGPQVEWPGRPPVPETKQNGETDEAPTQSGQLRINQIQVRQGESQADGEDQIDEGGCAATLRSGKRIRTSLSGVEVLRDAGLCGRLLGNVDAVDVRLRSNPG